VIPRKCLGGIVIVPKLSHFRAKSIANSFCSR
jgi:hypothetical protein